MHIFDESIEDPFENTICKEDYAVYETLPVVDGFLFSGNHIRSGVYFTDKATGEEFTYDEMLFEDKSNGECEVSFISENGNIIFALRENQVTISSDKDFVLENKIGSVNDFTPTVDALKDNELVLEYKGKKPAIRLSSGRFIENRKIVSENGLLIVTLVLI